MSDRPSPSIVPWWPIQARCEKPDANAEILIYDGVLDDTVKGYVDVAIDGKTVLWIDQTTGDPLPDPQFWADVPFPGDKK